MEKQIKVQESDELTFKKRFGNNLRTLRTDNGMSQTDLAIVTGISRNHIQKIESGKSTIGIEKYNTICEFFDIDWDILRPE